MKKKHPLKRTLSNSQRQLDSKSRLYAKTIGDSVNPLFFNSYNDQLSIKLMAGDFIGDVNDLITASIRSSVQLMLDKLQDETGKFLDVSDKLMLEAKIENQLRKKFQDRTLSQRIDRTKRLLTVNLIQVYRLNQAGLNQSYTDVLLGTPVYPWLNRLVSTEILRAYHYTVQEFARITEAKTISFNFDDDQLERNELYVKLADGGPYGVADLPDYPRPYASYLLSIQY